MRAQSVKALTQAKCEPCEGGVRPFTASEAKAQVRTLAGWQVVKKDTRIRKEWVVKDFMTGIHFFDQVAAIAEKEGHHPDLHLESYRNVSIEIWTHAIGGLSVNDFILAAKIDQLSVAVKA